MCLLENSSVGKIYNKGRTFSSMNSTGKTGPTQQRMKLDFYLFQNLTKNRLKTLSSEAINFLGEKHKQKLPGINLGNFFK